MASNQQIQALMNQYGVTSEQDLLAKLESEIGGSASEPSEPMRTMNVKQFLEGKGGRLVGADENGIAIAEMPDRSGKFVRTKFNPAEYIAGKGGDPTKFKIELNNANNALDESALGFSDGIKFELRQDPNSRLQFLQDRYGAENVVRLPEGAIKVKDTDGIWKRGDSTFKQTIAADSPAIAASIVGAGTGGKIGAVAGAIAGGALGLGAATVTGGAAAPAAIGATALGATWGRNLGMALGGAAGYVAAKYGTKELAQKLGLVTKDDVEAYKQEIGKELVTQTAVSLLLPPVINTAGKAIAGTTKAAVGLTKGIAEEVGTLGKEIIDAAPPIVGQTAGAVGDVLMYAPRSAGRIINQISNGPQLAKTLSAVFPTTKENHWKVMFESTDNLKAVQKELTEQRAWLDSVKSATEIDPILKKMSSSVDDILNTVKTQQSATYEAGLNFINPYIEHVHGSIGPAKEGFKASLRGLNLLDDYGNFIAKAADAPGVQVIADGPEREMLRHVYNEVNKIAGGEGAVKTLQNVIKATDGILEKNNVFGAPKVIGTNAERILTNFRAEASANLANSLRGKVKIPMSDVPGAATIDAADVLMKLRQNYHDYRKGYDGVIAALRAEGESKDGIFRALAKNFSDPGFDFGANFENMVKGLGNTAKQKVEQLKIYDAARGLAKDAFGMRGQITGPVGYVFTGGPTGVATSRFIGWGPAIQRGVRKAAAEAPATLDDIFRVQLLGKATDYISNLNLPEKQQLIGNPENWAKFMSILSNSALTYDATKQWSEQQMGQR